MASESVSAHAGPRFGGPRAGPKLGTGWAEERFDGRDKYYVPQTYVDTDAASGINLRTHPVYGKYFPKDFYDQGAWGTCVANASAMCFAYEWRKLGLRPFDPSRLFIYYNARKLAYDIWHDASDDPLNTDVNLGSRVRFAFKGLDKFGVSTEESWRYVNENFAKDPVDAADVDGLKHRTVRYERLDPDNPEEIAFRLKPQERQTIGNMTLLRLRQCLAEGYPVVFGFYGYQDFSTIWVRPKPGAGSDGIWSVIDLPKDNRPRGDFGGHAVLAIGFDDKKQRILCQNSWGASKDPGAWGDGKGVFWIGYDWIRDYEATADFWMMRLVESGAPSTGTTDPQVPITGRTVGISFSDNMTGANIKVDVQANGQDQTVSSLVANSTISGGGHLTSVNLVSNFQGATVVVKQNGHTLGTAKGDGNTYMQFSRTTLLGLTVAVTAA